MFGLALALAAEGARVRLVKGIYVEPPEIAIKDRQGIRDNYLAALDMVADIYRERVLARSGRPQTWGWEAAYGNS